MFQVQGTNWGQYPDRSSDENQQQTQPTYNASSGNKHRSTLVGGKCSHHCTIPHDLTLFSHAGTSSVMFLLPLVGRCPRLFQGKALQSTVDHIHHNQCLQSRDCGSLQPDDNKITSLLLCVD